MRGRYVRLSIGNWCNEIPGFFTNIGLNWTTSFPWEINSDGDEEPYLDEDLSQHPLMLNVQCNFKPIHDFTPENRKDAPFIIPTRKKRPPEPTPVTTNVEESVEPTNDDKRPMDYDYAVAAGNFGKIDFGTFTSQEAIPSIRNLEKAGIIEEDTEYNVNTLLAQLAFIDPEARPKSAFERMTLEERATYINNITPTGNTTTREDFGGRPNPRTL